ncbi:MAG TPA: 2-oxoacid:acceptor oxidoreductase family protein, partial [Dehalococcoidia bacterium]|nr:2-oxoacid:acceptor oxidoreductase family protein [Dehalococcoidia bacterium]
MSQQDLTWMIGGPQGSGINASAETFAKACTRAGYKVIADIEYHSNIMGEHSYYRMRVSDVARHALSGQVHVLVALDLETLTGDRHNEFPTHQGHLHEVASGGAVIYDAALKLDGEQLRDDIRLLPVPFFDLLQQTLAEFGRAGDAGKLRVVANSVALGASLPLAGLPLERLQEAIQRAFTGRRAELAEINVRAAARGYDYACQHYTTSEADSPFRLPLVPAPARPPLLIRGVQAAAIAKLRAGLAFQTYYPISPATDENIYLEANARRYGLVVVQTEDEISAINMAVGAAHAGVRASTSTSGPGFSLMVEGIGFAAITEAPGPVIFLWQRGGP